MMIMIMDTLHAYKNEMNKIERASRFVCVLTVCVFFVLPAKKESPPARQMVRKSPHPSPPSTPNFRTLLALYRILARDEPRFRAHLDRLIEQFECIEELRKVSERLEEKMAKVERDVAAMDAHIQSTLSKLVNDHARAIDKLRHRHEREMARLWNSFATGEDAALRGLCVAVGGGVPNGFPATLRDLNAMPEREFDRLLGEYRVQVSNEASAQEKRQLLLEFITRVNDDDGDRGGGDRGGGDGDGDQ
jgi:hypothetical protein